jgi:hypothetical protein
VSKKGLICSLQNLQETFKLQQTNEKSVKNSNGWLFKSSLNEFKKSAHQPSSLQDDFIDLTNMEASYLDQ